MDDLHSLPAWLTPITVTTQEAADPSSTSSTSIIPVLTSNDTPDASEESEPDEPKPIKFKRSPENKQIHVATLHKQYEGFFFTALRGIAEGIPLSRLVRNDMREFDPSDFYRWIKRDPDRKRLYEEAQEMQSEVWASDLVSIADGTDNPMEDVNRSKLRIETRRWLIGSYSRDRYGDVKKVEVSQAISITAALNEGMSRVIEGVHREVLEGDSSDDSRAPPLSSLSDESEV